MRIVPFLVLRGWQQNKLRTALTVLGVALGIAVVVAIHVMDHNTIQSRVLAAAAQTGRIDFELSPRERGRDPSEHRDEILARSDVAAVGVLHIARVLVHRMAGETVAPPEQALCQVYGILPAPDQAFGQYAVVEGSDLSPSDGDQGVLIGPAWVEQFDLRVGDRLQLAPPPRVTRTRCVDGERVPFGSGSDGSSIQPMQVVVKGVLGPVRIGARHEGLAMVGTLGLARRLSPGGGAVLQVGRAYGADADRLRQELAISYVVRDELNAAHGESSDERAFRNGVKLLGGLALMLGMFVVFQTLSHSLVERLRTIGLLRCLGTSGRSVSMVFLLDALGMAVSGAVLGVVLGLALAWLLKVSGFSSLGRLQHWEIHEIPLEPVVWTAVLGIGFTMAGAAFPLWRARGLSTLRILHARGLGGAEEVLRGVQVFLFGLLVVILPVGYLASTTLLSDSERETRAVLGQLAALLGVFGVVLLLAPWILRVAGYVLLAPVQRFAPLPVHLTRKALQGQTGRFAASVCGLGIVLVAGIGLESLTTALHGDARRFGREAMQDTVFVGLGDGISLEQARALEALEGVEHVEALRGPVLAPYKIVGLDSASMTRPGAPLAGDPERLRLFENNRSLVISRRLASLMDLQPGSAVPLDTDGGQVGYTVLAVSDAAGFFPDDPAWAVTHPRWADADFCLDDRRIDHLTLRLAPGTPPGDVVDAVDALHPGVRYRKSGRAFVDYLLRDVTTDFRLFQFLLALILGLAAMGVLNSMTIAALERGREIGVLRALGTSRNQLRAAFAVEGAVVGLLSAMVALALAVPLGQLVVRGMNEAAGLDAAYQVPVPALVAVPILALAVGVAASWVPGARAAAQDPARSVRFE